MDIILYDAACAAAHVGAAATRLRRLCRPKKIKIKIPSELNDRLAETVPL
jgi:hypothetical protein